MFQFTEPWSPTAGGIFYVKKDNPRKFNWQDLTNNTIGFIDGIVYSEHCVARDDRIKVSSIIAYSKLNFLEDRDDELLMDAHDSI